MSCCFGVKEKDKEYLELNKKYNMNLLNQTYKLYIKFLLLNIIKEFDKNYKGSNEYKRKNSKKKRIQKEIKLMKNMFQL